MRWRFLAVVSLLLCAPGVASASMIQLWFSGVWNGTLGVPHLGDPGSSLPTWDDATLSSAACTQFGHAPHRVCTPLLALTLNLPATTGLAVSGLPDHNSYIVFLGPGAVAVADVNFQNAIQFTTPITSGPTPIPEPATVALVFSGLGLLTLRRLAARRGH